MVEELRATERQQPVVQQEILAMLTDIRYRAGLEKIEAAFRTLMRGKYSSYVVSTQLLGLNGSIK